jgi:hypothetical protein
MSLNNLHPWRDMMKNSILILAALLLLQSCSPQVFPDKPGDIGANKRNKDGLGIEYTMFEIEGMPCVWIERTENRAGGENTGYAGLTCDWSRWYANNANQEQPISPLETPDP